MAGQSEKLTFTGVSGEQLAARLDRPDGKPSGYALFAHCFTCSKDIYAASRIAGGLTRHGIAVLRFDFTGLGASEGEFANTNFSSNVGDLVTAANFMRETLEAPSVLIGHSLGGAAVLAAAKSVAEAKAICTIGAPADPAHVAHNFGLAINEINEMGEAEVQLAGRPFRIQKQFLDDINGQKLDGDIAELKKALLVFHSPIDATVGVDNAASIFTAAKHPKSFVSLDDADHLLSRKSDAAYVADVIAAWATRYVGTNEQAITTPDIKAAPDTVVVASTTEGRLTNTISVGGRHTMRADEPVTYGGNDTGPTPYELLMSALGACKSMTMKLYADRKGFPMTGCKVTLKHDKIHAADCEECETKSGKIDDIDIDIEVFGDMDDDSRQRIADIADKCPVHRTLHSEVRINSQLK
jgi:uncharacterized OsmC-like protein/alpha-beta hydrolase superfamily lysophospholipase